MVTEPRRFRFTVDDFEAMLPAGILHEDDRVELIEGEIIEMAAQGSLHVRVINQLTLLLAYSVGPGLFVSVQNALRLPPDGEPQPDIAIVRIDAPGLPNPETTLLVIEVADSSLHYDRHRKLPIYAAAGILEAWIADIPGHGLERYTEPRNGLYRLMARAQAGEELVSTVLPQIRIPVDTIFG